MKGSCLCGGSHGSGIIDCRPKPEILIMPTDHNELRGYECNLKHRLNKKYWFETQKQLNVHFIMFHSRAEVIK
jgi:hypothetical protein